MYFFDLSRAVRVGVLGLSLTLVGLAVPVAAQNNNNASVTNTATTNTTATRAENRDDRREYRGVEREDDRDWGWLGLLGLAGLLGLMPRKRVPVVVNETRGPEVRERDPRDRR